MSETKTKRRKLRTRRAEGKDETLRFRATAEQAAELRAAAEREDLTLSAWLLSLGLKMARSGARVVDVPPRVARGLRAVGIPVNGTTESPRPARAGRGGT